MRAGTSTEQLRSTVDRVLAILNDPNLKSEARREERRARLRRVIYPGFDFAEMARRSLGPHWRRRTPQEQQEFAKLFTALVEESYVDKIESYKGEKVLYTNEVQEKNYGEVDTKVVTKKGEERRTPSKDEGKGCREIPSRKPSTEDRHKIKTV